MIASILVHTGSPEHPHTLQTTHRTLEATSASTNQRFDALARAASQQMTDMLEYKAHVERKFDDFSAILSQIQAEKLSLERQLKANQERGGP